MLLEFCLVKELCVSSAWFKELCVSSAWFKELCVSSTWFKREEKRKVTFRIGDNETEIDFVLIKKNGDSLYGNNWGVSSCLSDSRHR